MRRLAIVLGLVGLLAATLALPAALAEPADADAERSTSEVFTLPDEQLVVGASSTLIRTPAGVSFVLQTTGLEAGHAVTVWWMVFDHPEYCSAPCSMDDLSNPMVDASVLYAAGTVIGASGTLNLAGALRVGDADGALRDPEMGTGTGLDNPEGAAIYLVVRDHGLADPAIVDEQIHTFDVCNPEGVENCTDLQISMHQVS
jgi:hypothetical protein